MLSRWVPRTIVIVAAVVVGYLLFSTVNATLNSYRLAGDEEKARRDIAELEARYEKLVAIREYLSSDEYIEGMARRMLGLVKPGETLVKVTSPQGETGPIDGTPTPEPGDRAWWEELFGP
ncbi:MAG: septum formation initiator family protein [Dehalococcoidia bacterium]|nr:septum formation initiator family protein [Dehalococcoidia bacterium]